MKDFTLYYIHDFTGFLSFDATTLLVVLYTTCQLLSTEGQRQAQGRRTGMETAPMHDSLLYFQPCLPGQSQQLVF